MNHSGEVDRKCAVMRMKTLARASHPAPANDAATDMAAFAH